MPSGRFQFSLRGLLGYCTLVAMAMSAFRLGYVEFHGTPGLLCIALGFILSGIIIGIPVGLAIGGKRGSRRGAMIGAIILAIFILVTFPIARLWDGIFKITVNVASKTSMPITNIEYLGVHSREEANWIAQNPNRGVGLYQSAKDFDGKRFTACFPCGGREISIIDYEMTYVQYGFLVVHGQYQNGRHEYVVTEIPTGRGPRSMTLTVP
jgi:hypothetical protein